MSLIRFFIAAPFFGGAITTLYLVRITLGEVSVKSSQFVQLLGFIAGAFCLTFALIGRAIAGKQPVGTERAAWLEEFS